MSVIGNYELIEEIGEGTFGKVFKAKHKRTNGIVAVKIQHKEQSLVLKHEAKIYKYLNDISGVPIMRNYGIDSGFSYMVLDLFEPLTSIEISKKSCLSYMLSAITIIEKIHTRGVIHRDIKPDNFLLKNDGNGKHILYLIDFGLAKICISSDKKHIEERTDKKLIGTANYASLNIHNGIEASRRDDIESLCYTFISIYANDIPWYRLRDTYTTEEEKLAYYNQIKGMKMKPVDWLCNMPGEFITLLLYSRKLEFTEKPNYRYLYSLINNLLLIQ
jgi:serine/threonine protein kinase